MQQANGALERRLELGLAEVVKWTVKLLGRLVNVVMLASAQRGTSARAIATT